MWTVIAIVGLSSKFLKLCSKGIRRILAYSGVLRLARRAVHVDVKGRLKSLCHEAGRRIKAADVYKISLGRLTLAFLGRIKLD